VRAILPSGLPPVKSARRFSVGLVASSFAAEGAVDGAGGVTAHSILSTPRIVTQCPGNEHTKEYSPGSVGASNVTTVDSPAFSRRDATRTFGESV